MTVRKNIATVAASDMALPNAPRSATSDAMKALNSSGSQFLAYALRAVASLHRQTCVFSHTRLDYHRKVSSLPMEEAAAAKIQAASTCLCQDAGHRGSNAQIARHSSPDWSGCLPMRQGLLVRRARQWVYLAMAARVRICNARQHMTCQNSLQFDKYMEPMQGMGTCGAHSPFSHV